ncbi:MAG: TAT-variant-translocated molybdopterin oxidoreductase [Planctomycetota bacterium]
MSHHPDHDHSSADTLEVAAPSASAARPSVWRSLAEFDGDAEVAAFAKREFPTDDFDRLESPDRRRFMQILGASAALAGASSCRWEREEIVPHAIRPEDAPPGQRTVFSTVMDLAGAARPVRVESVDGRPIKVEPNELTGGGTDLFSQAAILGFYDPDRSREVSRGTTASSWSAALEALRGAAVAGKCAVLASTSSSPTLHRLAAAARAAGVRWTWYSPLDRDHAIAGARMAFGRPVRVQYDLGQADVVLSLDSDFQRDHADAVALASALATRRMPESSKMSRVYAVEARFTSSGLSSDHRLPLRASDVGAFVELVEAKIAGTTPSAAASAVAAKGHTGLFAEAVADDLKAAGAHAAIVVGDGQPAAVHARVHGLLARLGAVGTTTFHTEEPLAEAGAEALKGLVDALNGGQVDSLVILEGNPVYDAPGALGFGAALTKAKTVAHVSLYRDETTGAALAHGGWHLPVAHWLEAWGDARSFDGSVHLAQPLIAPLYGGKSAIEVVAAMLGMGAEEATGAALVRATFDATAGDDTDGRWNRALHDGVVAGTAFRRESLAAGAGAAAAIEAAAAGMELNLHACPKVLDGRFANNGWLQELPDAVTKLTWDNALCLGVKTAAQLKLETGDMAKVTVGGASLDVVAYVMAGHAEDSASLALGYGRTAAGVIAGFKAAEVSSAGFNAYPLSKAGARGTLTGAQLAKGRGKYKLAATQEHHLIDAIGMSGRAERLPFLAREGTLEEYTENPEFAKERVHLPKNMRSLFDTKVYDGDHQWGMTIDLAACNGCNACVIACQSENNIPIVGKEQVSRGREMHWMRVDFYFQGDAQDAETIDAVSQPVNCLQCENAPCEQVCPVAATVHSQEGLNDMVYNRCIGTRYCGNNCPAKVRRFNYFHYTKFMDKPGNKVLQLAQNPDVTVRSRGVMEKCTYCIQRISAARIKARNVGRLVQDGEVVTSCQSACPPNAITFGNIKDETSAVAKKRNEPRAYAMLEELNIRPRTLYMAKVANLNPKLKDAMKQGAFQAGTIPKAHHGGGHSDAGHAGTQDTHGGQPTQDGHGAADHSTQEGAGH